VINEVLNVRPVNAAGSVPDGRYDGKWTGYLVQFVVDETVYEGESDDGIRGIDVPCVVTKLGDLFSVTARMVD